MKYNVSIVGASGMVGRELIFLIEKRKFPVNEIFFFNTGKKESVVEFKGKEYKCRKIEVKDLEKSHIVFFVSTNEIARRYAPYLAKKKIWCIDDSSEFRLDKNIPLIIPEINPELIKNSYLISGPNCTLTPLAVSCFNIHKKYEIEEIRLSTYQAVSGAGKAALNQLFKEINHYLKTGKIPELKNKTLPHPIAFNIFPQVGSFDREGISSEERKVELELKKIWKAPEIKISVNTVRVPTIRVHCLNAWIKTKKSWTINELEKTFSNSKGVKYFKNPYYSTPLNTQKSFEVTVSRLRKTPIKNEFQVWLCGDNLYKGAALNSIQIAEKIIAEYN